MSDPEITSLLLFEQTISPLVVKFQSALRERRACLIGAGPIRFCIKPTGRSTGSNSVLPDEGQCRGFLLIEYEALINLSSEITRLQFAGFLNPPVLVVTRNWRSTAHLQMFNRLNAAMQSLCAPSAECTSFHFGADATSHRSATTSDQTHQGRASNV